MPRSYWQSEQLSIWFRQIPHSELFFHILIRNINIFLKYCTIMVQIHQWSEKFLFADYLNSIWHVMSFLIQIACCICCIYTRLQFVVYVYLDEISYIQRKLISLKFYFAKWLALKYIPLPQDKQPWQHKDFL